MKKEYALKQKVWIHNGELSLVPGRIVEIIDLSHLGEGHSSEEELYIVEIDTGIDNVYEVRSWKQTSPDEAGPINLYRNTETRRANRYFKKVGMKLPDNVGTNIEEVVALESAPTKPRRKYHRKPK